MFSVNFVLSASFELNACACSHLYTFHSCFVTSTYSTTKTARQRFLWNILFKGISVKFMHCSSFRITWLFPVIHEKNLIGRRNSKSLTWNFQVSKCFICLSAEATERCDCDLEIPSRNFVKCPKSFSQYTSDSDAKLRKDRVIYLLGYKIITVCYTVFFSVCGMFGKGKRINSKFWTLWNK